MSLAGFIRGLLWLLIPAAFVFRLWYIGRHDLAPDEAFYWVLSRHLAGGYLDHPPLVALSIKLGTWLLGSTERGVRLLATPMAFASLLLLMAMARRVAGRNSAALIIGFMWLCNPFFTTNSSLMTPDTPAILFSLCALACALVIAQRAETSERPRALELWVGFGIFCGLSLLSKYTTILLPVSVLLALLTSRSLRKEFRRPGVYLSALVALIEFSPTILWNARHHWASFAFQLHHGLQGGDAAAVAPNHLKLLGDYLAGQLLIGTPVLLVIGLVVLVIRWRNYARLDGMSRMLLWSATLPLVFFALAATRVHGELNWPSFAYLPMNLLIAQYASEKWTGQRARWVKIGAIVALVMSLAIQFPEPIYAAGVKIAGHLHRPEFALPNKLNSTSGWREWGEFLDATAEGTPVIANRYQDAALASFYMRGQPEVWCVSVGMRPSAYEYFDDVPDVRSMPKVLFVLGRADLFCQTYGFKEAEPRQQWKEVLMGQPRMRTVVVCEQAAAKN